MGWLNFIPLLVWALGCLALGQWEDHLRQIDGRSKLTDEDSDAFAEIFLGGCASLFLVGALLSV